MKLPINLRVPVVTGFLSVSVVLASSSVLGAPPTSQTEAPPTKVALPGEAPQKTPESSVVGNSEADRNTLEYQRVAEAASLEKRDLDQAAKRRQASLDRARAAKQKALLREASCDIRQAMTDAEIENCRQVRRLPPP